MLRIVCAGSMLAVIALFSGCSTRRVYDVPFERLVDAARDAIAAEARVEPAEVKRTDIEEKGGPVTILEAPYLTYSRIQVAIDRREKKAEHPEVQVRVTTSKGFESRHMECEERVHELMALKLRARKHGEESKPTELRATTAPATAAPQPEAKKN